MREFRGPLDTLPTSLVSIYRKWPLLRK